MKKLFSLFVVAVLSLVTIVNVNAADTMTFGQSKTFDNYKKVLYLHTGTTYKTATKDGKTYFAYCFNHLQNAPTKGTTLYRRALTATETKYNDAYLYILQNGYGGSWNSSLLGAEANYTREERYYITQLALWLLQNDTETDATKKGVTYNSLGTLVGGGTKTLYRDKAHALKQAAMSYKQQQPSLSIAGNTNMYITAQKDYYRSADMTVAAKGTSEYKVEIKNLPSGVSAEIVEVGTNKVYKSGDTLKVGKKFYIRIPIAKVTYGMKPKIVVSAQGTLYELAIYEPRINGVQDVGILYPKPVPLSDDITVLAEPKGNLKITKVELNGDGTYSNLANVSIVVKNSAGTQVASWTTTSGNNPYTVPNLPIGTYTVIETNAPEGYTKSSNINVTVKAGQTIQVRLVNVKGEPVYISKQDITTKSELPGATLVLKDAVGNKIDEWVSTNEPHLITAKLTPGMEYTLTETIAPPGYLKTEETIKFKVNAKGGLDKTVVMYNTPVPTTPVKISKQDITTGKELPGAKLVVKDANGNIIDEWVSTTEPHYLPELKDGKYTLIETIAPEGYGISEEVIEFEVKNNGVEQTVVMTNSPIPKTGDANLVLIVVGLVGTVALAGFSIFKLNKQAA